MIKVFLVTVAMFSAGMIGDMVIMVPKVHKLQQRCCKLELKMINVAQGLHGLSVIEEKNEIDPVLPVALDLLAIELLKETL